jgi:hypothetical protein
VKKIFQKMAFAIGACSVAIAAQAAPVTFFGEDPVTSMSIPVGSNAAAARGNFLSSLIGVGNQDFEGFADNTGAPINLTFPGSSGGLTATLNGAGRTGTEPDTGRWATSGQRFYRVDSGGAFVVNFGTAISAFGFYGTDIGDFDNRLIVTLTASNGTETAITVPHSTGLGNFDASLLFWGFVDSSTTYTSIRFSNSGSGGDVFAFDDLVIGDREQVRDVPLPATLGLFLGGLGLLAARRRRS